MKLYYLLPAILILTQCTLINPSYLLIKNHSNYDCLVTINQQSQEIKKEKAEYFLLSPAEYQITIWIEEFQSEFKTKISISYQEKKMYTFEINKDFKDVTLQKKTSMINF